MTQRPVRITTNTPGRFVPGVQEVSVALCAPGFTADKTLILSVEWLKLSATTGTAVIELDPNSGSGVVNPPGTWYVATFPDGDQIAFEVPDAAPSGAAYELNDLIVSDLSLPGNIVVGLSWAEVFGTPGGTAVIATPEQYGAAGDGVTNDGPALQAAIDAVAAQGYGYVLLQALIYLTNQTLILKHGVTIAGQRFHRDLLGSSGSTIYAGPSLTTGWIIETDTSTAWAGASIVGCNIKGRGASMTTLLGGIHVTDHIDNIKLQDLVVSGVSNSAIGFTGQPVGCLIDNCVVSMDDSHLTLTGPVGALHITGTDHIVRSCEVARGPSDTASLSGFKKVTYSGFWRCAIYVAAGSSWFGDNVGEFGDTAYYIDTVSGFNTFTAPRADFSAGHGFYVLGSDNQFIGARTLGAGLYSQYSGPATSYDGVYHGTGSKRNKWTNYTFTAVTGIPVARYGWADWSTGNTARDANELHQANIQGLDVVGDVYYQANRRSSIYPPGAGPLSARPPSRQAVGAAWFDTDHGIPTFSDGTWWRDYSGAQVGNLANARRSTGQGGDNTIAWQNFGSSCTVAKGTYFLGTTAAKLLGRQNYAICTANSTAATNGYLETNQNIPAGDPTFPAVIAGHTYTVVVQTTAETVARAVSIRCRWRDVNQNTLQTDNPAATGGGTNSTFAATTTYLQGCVAPTNAVYLDVIVRIGAAASGMTAGEVHNVQNLAIVPDTARVVTEFSHP